MQSVATRLLLAAAVLLPSMANAQGNAAHSGRPANLCQELAAFVRQPADAMKAVETPPQLATAVTARKSGETSEKPSAGARHRTPRA